jgi:hypothetical protein
MKKLKILKDILFLTIIRNGLSIIIWLLLFQALLGWLFELPLLFSLFSHFIVWHSIMIIKIKPTQKEYDDDMLEISNTIKELKQKFTQ